mmetsp:Transcript_15153/g.35487  ORF Transcript_15153/g.35487 Transcript_15153/m.35487 type:complete len:209 (+) Transcript_15153:1863-2489(+)
MPRATSLSPFMELTSCLKRSARVLDSAPREPLVERTILLALHSRRSSSIDNSFQMNTCLNWPVKKRGSASWVGSCHFSHCLTSSWRVQESKLLTRLSTLRATSRLGNLRTGIPKDSHLESANNCSSSERGWSLSTLKPRSWHSRRSACNCRPSRRRASLTKGTNCSLDIKLSAASSRSSHSCSNFLRGRVSNLSIRSKSSAACSRLSN